MSIVQQTWEYRLNTFAEEALQNHGPASTLNVDQQVLANAYHHCDMITRIYSRTFYLASGLLPENKRRAVRALYAFCRVTDDIVDRAEDQARRETRLAEWHSLVSQLHPPTHEQVALAWADAKAQFKIPNGYALQLIEGVAKDLYQTRYRTFDELAEYSYGVASTVGLMAMHIVGFQSDAAIPYAVKLGVALQITNILRDVGEDWRTGRLYLPQNELEAFGISEQDIDRGLVSDKWRAFMQFQIERNRKLYEESLPGIQILASDGRFAISAAAELYRALLDDIETHDYDVFSRRAHVGTMGKFARLPGIWMRSRNHTFV